MLSICRRWYKQQATHVESTCFDAKIIATNTKCLLLRQLAQNLPINFDNSTLGAFPSMRYMWFWYIKICRQWWDSNPRQTPRNLKRVVVLLARLPGEGRQIITISQSFREDSIVGRCDIVCRDRMIHKKLMNSTTSMKKSTIQPSFLRRLGVWQSLRFCQNWVFHKKGFRTNKFIIIIMTMIIGQLIYQQAINVQHDS